MAFYFSIISVITVDTSVIRCKR